ncbi:universal stress protein [Phytohabitans suffuscus]
MLVVSNGFGEADGRVVVGVDGSVASKAALRWAADQVRLTGATLQAVTAWEYPALYGWGPTYPYEDFAGLAGKVLTKAVREALGPSSEVDVRETVSAGHPARVLIDVSERAQALVVGSHGVGGFVGAMLGSVSQYCAHHARCPLVIIRGAE